jgi:hypothetical protein
MCVSWEASILAVGQGTTVSLWDVRKIRGHDIVEYDGGINAVLEKDFYTFPHPYSPSEFDKSYFKNKHHCLVKVFKTKNTVVKSVKFTLANLLLVAGVHISKNS